MTTYPALFVQSTLQGTPQTQLTSLHGRQFGLGSTGTVIVAPDGKGSTGAALIPTPLKPEAAGMISGTTADVLSNYLPAKLTSTAVSAIFTVADPVPGCSVELVLNANPSTTIKFVTASSNVTFSSSASSFSITNNSSLFFDQATLSLIGMSTGAYRIKSYFNNNGSTLGIVGFTT